MLVENIQIVPIGIKNNEENWYIRFASNSSLIEDIIPYAEGYVSIYEEVEIWAINQNNQKIRKIWDQTCSFKENESRVVKVSLYGIWVEIHPKMLIQNDVIKFFESDGTPIAMFPSEGGELNYVGVFDRSFVREDGQWVLVIK